MEVYKKTKYKGEGKFPRPYTLDESLCQSLYAVCEKLLNNVE